MSTINLTYKLKNTFFLIIGIIGCLNYANGQDYNFINEIFKEKSKDLIYLPKNFAPVSPIFNTKMLLEDAFTLESIWNPNQIDSVPDIKPFLEGVNLEHFVAITNLNNEGLINFSKLSNDFKWAKNSVKHLDNNGIILRISKPFISCGRDWGIIFMQAYSLENASVGNIYIYRKVDEHWILYHQLDILS